MWTTAFTTARDDYARFLAAQDTAVGAFLEIGTPPQWRGPGSGNNPDADSTTAPGVPPHSDGISESAQPYPLAVKDNIAVTGYRLTCGSKMLEELVSPYDATAVTRLTEAGATVVGKTNLDEFGMGSSTDTSALGTTNNPWDDTRVAGGSSGGSAAAVAQRLVPVAIGSDTGGSIRQPAAFCGVYGLKPTYGAVSRFGLVAYASSLEVIGAFATDLDDLTRVWHAMRGVDGRDQSSVAAPGSADGADARRADAAGSVTDGKADAAPSRRVVGVLSGDLGLDPEVARGYAAAAEALRAAGYQTREISLSTLEYVVPAYYTIAMAEASANLARFNGVRYGYQPMYAENPEELMRAARSQALGAEVKLRIVLGTYVLRSGFQDQYYTRAQKIRTLIRQECDALFTEIDTLLMPVFPTQPFAHGDTGMDPFQQKVADRFTCTANLAALPALALPVGSANGLPLGVQLMGASHSEDRLIAIAGDLAATFPVEQPAGAIPFDEWLAAGGTGRDGGSGRNS